MNFKFHNFVKIGDASDELKKLYSEGWRLITVSTSFAISASESNLLIGSNKNNHLYIYGIEYFLEKQTN